MLPLSFFIAAVLGLILAREVSAGVSRDRNIYLLAFLGVMILQLILVGLRFGYGVEVVRQIQPFTASFIGPLAYLSFAKPDWTRVGSLAAHALPFACAVLTVTFAIGLVDASQGFFLLVYAALLIQLGFRGEDALGWAELERSVNIYRSLWFVVGVLLLSAITDWLVAFDYWTTGGVNTSGIAGKANLVALVLLILAMVAVYCLYRYRQRRDRSVESASSPHDQAGLVTRVTELLDNQQLHLDPNLNLIRLARKLGVPQRQVSEAINRHSGLSVSQFINNRRIDAVCGALLTTDLSITQIMSQSGFNTKSNFNREFRRKMGASPTVWRRRRRAA